MRKRPRNVGKRGMDSTIRHAPQQVVDEMVYREHTAATSTGNGMHFDSQFSGWTNPSRPVGQPIFVRVYSPPPG